MSTTPMLSSQSRVFLIESGARPDHTPEYKNTFMAGSPSQSYGDITPIRNPDPDSYGKFIEVGSVRGQEERATMDITGRYAREIQSDLLRIAKQKCPADLLIVMGACRNPKDLNSGWDKIMAMHDAQVTNWSTDNDLGALQDDQNSVVNEVASLSAREIFEIVRLNFTRRADDVITNEVVDVVMDDTQSCGDECDEASDGADTIFALTLSAGGSPGTPADVVLSKDKGASWRAVDVDTLGAAEDPSAISIHGGWVVVVSNASNSLHYVSKENLLSTAIDESWSEVTTGFVASYEPNDISSMADYSFIVGDGGYVYGTGDPASGVDVLDAGIATSYDLNAVHALSREFAVAVGNSGAVIYTENGSVWGGVTTSPSGISKNLTAVWAMSEKEWFVGTNDGTLYWTDDQGETWSTISFPGSGTGVIRDIKFANGIVGYLSHDTTAPRGRILRTITGGERWYVLPEGTGTVPASDRFNALACNGNDENFVIAGGLDDAGSDGILVQGS
jgi:hypothetical protein